MEPAFLYPGDGEATSDRPDRTVRIKADTEALVVTESRYPEGEHGPASHVHHRHTDAFYVLAGALVFEVGSERRHVRADAGTFVAVPSETVHTFWNDGPGEAWFLNVHAPGERFAEYLRAARDGLPNPGFDTDDPPADGGRPAADVVIRRAGEGEEGAMGPAGAVITMTADEADGTFTCTEASLPAGSPGPPPHVHERITDSFYVLEGTPVIQLGDRTTATLPGTFVVAPPGTVHTFANPGGRPARVLNLTAPAGSEPSGRELLTGRADEPDDPAPGADIGTRHDVHTAR